MTDHILLVLIVAAIVPAVLLVLPQQSKSPRMEVADPPPAQDCPPGDSPIDCGLASSLMGKYIDYVKPGSVGVVIGTPHDLVTWSKHFSNRVTFWMLNDKSNDADIVVDCQGGELFESLFAKPVVNPGGLYFMRGHISQTVSETLEDVLTDIHRIYWGDLVVGAERFTPRHGIVKWTRTLEWGMSEAVVFKRMKQLDIAAPD